jgi:hypothetical protein
MMLLGSGVAGWVHQQSHAHHHAVVAGEGHAGTTVRDAKDGEFGGVCEICLQLHMPLMSAVVGLLLTDSGERVFCVAMESVGQKSQGVVGRISCRGPPASC